MLRFLILAGFCVGLSLQAAGQRHFIRLDQQVVDASLAPWSAVLPGDTLWLEAGVRGPLLLLNFRGTEQKPLVIANRLGQTILDTEFHYGIDLRYSSHIRILGIPGEGYEYGIFIRRVSAPGSVGIAVNNKSSDVEIAWVEITAVGFAGIMAKTDPHCNDSETLRGNFVQRNTRIHHCYIHDVPGEAIYVGSSFYKGQEVNGCGLLLPSLLEGVYVHNNRIENTGLDGIQVSSAVKDCYIHDNLLINCSYLRENAQMSGIIIGGGSLAECHSNIILDSYGTGILLFGKGGSRVYNNLIVRPGMRYYPDDPSRKEHGIFVADKSGDSPTFYAIYQNTIIQPKSDGIRILDDVTFPVFIMNNVIVDPGAFTEYENDQTQHTGEDAYVFRLSQSIEVILMGNWFGRDLQQAGFANPLADDYHPQPISPLVDQGIGLEAEGIHHDLEGNPRPMGAGYDIGCFEYNPSLAVSEIYLGKDGPGSKKSAIIRGLRYGSNGAFQIELAPDLQGDLHLHVFDTGGRLVQQQTVTLISREADRIDLSIAEPGIYLLRLMLGNQVETIRMLSVKW